MREKATILEIEFKEPVEVALIESVLINAGFSTKEICVVERIEVKLEDLV